MRYSVGIVVWTVEEFASIHRKNRTILPMNGSLYTRSNVTRLSLPRKDRGRGLIGIKVCGNKRRKAFHGYLSGCCKWYWRRKCLLKKITFNYDCQRTRKERNALHGEFAWQTASWSDVGGEDRMFVEGLILAAQELALRTNSIQHSIYNTPEKPLQIMWWPHRNSMAYFQWMQEACP